ncbi:MAG TPA: hypothetical protein VGD61_05460 [Pyrinomonadaceae bacterium]
MSDVQIFPPLQEESCYRYTVRIGSLDRNSFLTYELFPERREDKRSILLAKENDSLLTGAARAEYNKFIEIARQGSTSALGSQKNLVNLLADGILNLPNVHIVVSKYGPVPAFVLPDTYTIDNLGERLEVRIGVASDGRPPTDRSQARGRRLDNYWLPYFNSRLEFLNSLQKMGLDLMFRRYFEDIGEYMFDIENHLDLPGVFKQAMRIQTTLGESVDSKLDQVIPSPQTYRRPNNQYDIVVNDIFEKNLDWVFTASYARNYVLFFVNELYSLIGMSVRDKYLNNFQAIESVFNNLVRSNWSEDARSKINEVAVLSNALDSYLAGDIESLEQIKSQTLWIKRFVRFAQFLLHVKQRTVGTSAGRLFISYHHDVPKSVILRNQIKDQIRQSFGDRVNVLYVEESGAGMPFVEQIKSSIWQSDIFGGFLPKDTQDLNDRDKNYLWIAREAEHALLLKKRTIFFAEDGLDEETVKADFANEAMGFLVPDARTDNERVKKIIDRFEKYTRARFAVSSTNPDGRDLDSNARKVILEEAQRSINNRHDAIVIGLFNQFPGDVRQTLARIQQIVPYGKGMNKQALTDRLMQMYPRQYSNEQQTRNLITNAWDGARKRSLELNGYKLSLMSRTKSDYVGGLRRILKVMRPDLDQSTIRTWERSILMRIDKTIRYS